MADRSAVAGQVVLKPRKSGPFFARHPWVLDASIGRVIGTPANGDVVDLLTDRSEFVARGIYNASSRINVRLYTWDKSQALDADFWRGRLFAARQLREQLGYTEPSDAARMVFSEADGLSGLVIDRYGTDYVVQLTAQAMGARIEMLMPMIVEIFAPRSVLLRSDPNLAQTEGIQPHDRAAHGELPSGPITIRQHGVDFRVDLTEGQKTGFYLDQRENRRVAAELFGGRRVLDVCCYTGAFGLIAAKHGAAEVVCVDASAKAIEAARANAALNAIGNVSFEAGDCFDLLEAMAKRGERFGGIVLDPPRFAGSRSAVERALSAYNRLNSLAVKMLEPGGWLVTCSCSAHVTREDFQDMVATVSAKMGRDIQLVQQRGASPDHPVSATCEETEYLKCFVCRVL